MSEKRLIDDEARYWDAHALSDPMWAALSDPQKRGRQWNIDQFFETGRREISVLVFQLESLGLMPPRTRACDFGCGIGRLSQALAEYFDHVVGVDVAPTMIRLAEHFNQFPDRVSYVHNQAEELAVFAGGQFTFLYSDIVLQHVPPALGARYLREFLRVLAPGGTAVFQLPSERRSPEELPPEPQPLPSGAYRAEIRVLHVPDASYQTAAPIELTVSVRNGGTHSWRNAAGAIRVGNHWRDASTGAMVIQDDGRAGLPPLDPGESCLVRLAVRTPDVAGRFVCEIDAVHEGLFWFADRESPTLQIVIQVGVPSATAVEENAPGVRSGPVRYGSSEALYELLPAAAPTPGDFPMYGLARDAVETLVSAAGGAVRLVERDDRCGREWIGYRYYVQKNAEER